MRAGEVQLEPIDAGRLHALDDLDPRVLVVLLHDRGDDDAVGVLVLELLELVDPDLERPIGDQLDVLPAEDLLGLFRCAGGRSAAATLTTLEASRLIVLAMTAPQPSSNALPMTLALVPGGPEPMTKGLGSFRAVDGGCEGGRCSITRVAEEHESTRIYTNLHE